MDNGVTTIRIDCNGSEVVNFDRCWRNFKVDNFTDNTIYFSTISEITDPTNELYDVVAVPSGGSGVNGQTPATKSVYLYATGEVQITASNNIGSFKIGGGVGSDNPQVNIEDGIYDAVKTASNTLNADNGSNTYFTNPIVKLDFNNNSRAEDQTNNFFYTVISPDNTSDPLLYASYSEETGSVFLYNAYKRDNMSGNEVVSVSSYSGKSASSYKEACRKHTAPEYDLDKLFVADIRMRIDGLPVYDDIESIGSMYPVGQCGLVVMLNAFAGLQSKGLCLAFAYDMLQMSTVVTCCTGQIESIGPTTPTSDWNYENQPIKIPFGRYARYTITYNNSTNELKLYIDGVLSNTFTITSDNIGRPNVTNLVQLLVRHCAGICGSSSDYGMQEIESTTVYVDKIYVYNEHSLLSIPDGSVVGMFTDYTDYDLFKYNSIASNILSNSVSTDIYSASSLSALQNAVVNNISNLVPSEAQTSKTKLFKALSNLVFKDTTREKISIAFDYNDSSSTWGAYNGFGYGIGYPYAWTNACIMFTESGYDCATYQNAGGYLNRGWASIVLSPTGTPNRYYIDNIYDYEDPNNIGDRVTIVPNGGLIIYLHKPQAISDPDLYMSKDFGSDNSVAFQDIYSAHDAGALSYLDLYIPTSIYPNKTSVNTIGAWYSKHDPQFLRSDIEIPTGMKDYFKDFKTFVYLYY